MNNIFLLAIVLLMTSCVERSIQVESDPPGAMVILDEVKSGFTPITIPFSHYGVRKIRIEKLGYQKKTLIEDIERPWYETTGISIFADVFWPFTIEDVHAYKVKLEPLKEEGSRGLIERAQEARQKIEGAKTR